MLREPQLPRDERSCAGNIWSHSREDELMDATPDSMRTAALTRIPSDELTVARTAVPAVDARDEVLLRVEACGVCATDLHIMEGISYRPALPFVLGHEPVGVV